MSTYTLSYIVKEKDSETVSLVAIEPICETTLQSDKENINDHHDSFKLIQCVQINIQELFDVISEYEQDFFETRSMQESKVDYISLNISRLILNILSMFRSLLDHSDASISRRFGKNSEEIKLWKNTLSGEYDSSFEYRFLYKLRNYSQHVGMPPINLSFTDKGSINGTIFEISILKNTLLEEKKLWGKQVREDLESQDEKIPLLQILEKWITSYKNIAKVLLKIKREQAFESSKRIIEYESKYNLPSNSRLCVVKMPDVMEDTKNLNITLDWIPSEKAKLVMEVNPFK